MKYVEILFCLLEFAVQLTEPIRQNFIRYQTCYVTLGYNESECAALGTGNHTNRTDELEKATEPYVTVLNTSKDLVDAFISVLICFFLGAWSDKYGRRPLILSALAGYTLSYIAWTVIVTIKSLSPWYLFISILPLSLVGGFPILLSSIICYITDTTTFQNKGVRLGVFEVSIMVSKILGNTFSSYAFKALGYTQVFAISTACILLAFLLMLFVFPESLPNPESADLASFKSLFDFSQVKEAASATFKRRRNNDRALLLLVITIIIIYFMAVTADGNLEMLYLSNKLHWSLEHYTWYLNARSLGWMSGSLIGVFILHKFLGIKEAFLILLGMFSMMLSALMLGVGFKDWHIYFAAGSLCFGGVISPMTRSLVSKIANSGDAGKVFSFTVICQTLIVFVGRPLYTLLYNNTLNTVPGAYNFVTVGVYVVEMILTIPVIVLQIKRLDEDFYENLGNENNHEENEYNNYADNY